MRRQACALLVATQLVACTTLRPVETPRGAGIVTVAPGDAVSLTTTDGKRIDLAVTSASHVEICGTGECVRVAEIAKLERRELSVFNTFLLVLAIAVVVVGGLAAAAPAGFMMGPPVFP